jgi:hypothetical protein
MPSSGTGLGIRRSLEDARELVQAWRSSGMSKKAWCQKQRILRSSLHSYLTRVDRADGVLVRPEVSGFVEVRPPRTLEPSVVGLQIELGGGMRVVGLDLGDVVSVLRTLRES